MVSFFMCAQMGGTPSGPSCAQAPCTPLACCLPTGGCEVLSQGQCIARGGTPQAQGTCTPGMCPPSAGDLNCDGAVNFNDINPFVLALVGPGPYYAAYPNCNVNNADCNHDGRVDFEDINPFVELLIGP